MFGNGKVRDGWKTTVKQRRRDLGKTCPGCVQDLLKRIPAILLPNQLCGACGYRDPRPDDRVKHRETADVR